MTEEKGLTVKPVNALPTSLEEVKGMADKGTELTISKSDVVLTNWKDIQDIGDAFFTSGMFSDVKSKAQAIVKIIAGSELGLPPVYSMQNINLIRDRLTSSANTMALLVKRSKRYDYRIKEHTDLHCVINFYERDGDKWVEVGQSAFSIEDAKRANLLKPDSGWIKYPRAMLFSRAISQGARIYAPDAIGGIYTVEEIQSIPPKLEDAVPNTPKSTQDEQVTAQKAEVVESGSPIDLDWLRESLETLQWADAAGYLKKKYGVAGASVSEKVKALIPEQAKEFVAEVEKRLKNN